MPNCTQFCLIWLHARRTSWWKSLHRTNTPKCVTTCKIGGYIGIEHRSCKLVASIYAGPSSLDGRICLYRAILFYYKRKCAVFCFPKHVGDCIANYSPRNYLIRFCCKHIFLASRVRRRTLLIAWSRVCMLGDSLRDRCSCSVGRVYMAGTFVMEADDDRKIKWTKLTNITTWIKWTNMVGRAQIELALTTVRGDY